jgi:hypothetical protein
MQVRAINRIVAEEDGKKKYIAVDVFICI